MFNFINFGKFLLYLEVHFILYQVVENVRQGHSKSGVEFRAPFKNVYQINQIKYGIANALEQCIIN